MALRVYQGSDKRRRREMRRVGGGGVSNEKTKWSQYAPGYGSLAKEVRSVQNHFSYQNNMLPTFLTFLDGLICSQVRYLHG